MELRHRTIDVHAHLMGEGFTPEVSREAAALGIDHFVVSNIGDYVADPSKSEIRELNAATEALVRSDPARFSGYAYLNPRHDSWSLRELDRAWEGGLIGVKLWIAALADDPRVLPIVRACAERRALVLVHAWDKATGQLPNESTAHHVARLAAECPDARLVMAHLGGFLPTATELVRPHPNVCVDTSGTVTATGQVRHAVSTLGAERVLFGSDATMACLATNVGKVLDAELDDASSRLVMGGNAQRLLEEVLR